MEIKSITLRGGKKDVIYTDDSGNAKKVSFPATMRTAEIEKELVPKTAKPDLPKKNP